MTKTKHTPVIEEKSKAELDEIIDVIRASSLPQHVKDFIINCVEMALWFPSLLQKKNISLNRLRIMLFGKGHTAKKWDATHIHDAATNWLKNIHSRKPRQKR